MNRRAFLKSAGLSAAACTAWSPELATSTGSDKIKISGVTPQHRWTQLRDQLNSS